MNLFLDYQKKIFKSLKNLEKRNKIKIPSKLKSFAVELPPQNQRADISCNAAMILAKTNNSSPINLAETLKKYLLRNSRKHISRELFKNEQKERVIADFIAGMTDRSAINLHKKIK